MSDVLFRLLRGLGKTLITTGMKFFLSFLVKIRVVTSGKTFGAHNELLNQLEKKLVLIQGDQPRNSITMLFCPITSRVGSDVKAAMSLVSEDQNVILVLMHHTRDGSYSTAGTEWSGVYRNIILAVHVLFHESVPGFLIVAALCWMTEILTSGRLSMNQWEVFQDSLENRFRPPYEAHGENAESKAVIKAKGGYFE